MINIVKCQTLIKVCQSWFFAPPKSPCSVNMLVVFEAKPMENVIFKITSFTTSLSSFVNNHGKLVSCP